MLPEALQLRKDDLEIEGLLDRQPNETQVRRELESFNARIVGARMQLQGGPPVITKTRDVEAEVGPGASADAPVVPTEPRPDTPRTGGIVALANYNTVV